MRAKSVPRSRKWQSTCKQPVVQNPNRTVWIDRQRDDIALHEALRRSEGERERRRSLRNRFESAAQLVDSHRRRDWSGSRRPCERDMRGLIPRELRIVALVDRAHPLRDLLGQLGQNEYPVQQALLVVEADAESRIVW